MAFPIVQYDASSGSGTAPTGADGSGTNGDISSTTLTLNETVDFTGVADDDSDYLWYDGTSGDRHLFRVTAFNPSVAACTTITVQETATTRTGNNWAVNGVRQTWDNDTGQPDPEDWGHGWTIRFEAGTYVGVGAFRPGFDTGIGTGVEPILTVEAEPGAASRPVIDIQANAGLFFNDSSSPVSSVKGLKFESTTGGGSLTLFQMNGSGQIFDCVIDATGGSATRAIDLANVGAVSIVGCHISGGTQYGIISNTFRGGTSIWNCTIDGAAGSDHSVAGIDVDALQGGISITDCFIFDASGDGITIEASGSQANVRITGNTIVDCGGDGISTYGSASGEDLTGIIMNNLICYNGAFGMDAPAGSSDVSGWLVDYNALFTNTSGNYNGDWSAGTNDVTVTADPFTNRASDDYTLNSTAGGGAAVKQAAFPTGVPDGT